MTNDHTEAQSLHVSPNPLTRAAYDALCAERAAIDTTTLPEAAEHLRAIQDAGDPEGLESTAAVFEVQRLQSEIDRIDRILAGAHIIEPGAHTCVEVGALVTLDLGDGLEEYRIDTQPAAGSLSPQSPIGAAIVGLQAGEQVRVTTPAGVITVHVVHVA